MAGEKAIAAVTEGRVERAPRAVVCFVEGSEGDLYTVVLPLDRDHADVCTCPAGQHGRRCYHVEAAELLAHRDALGSPPVGQEKRS